MTARNKEHRPSGLPLRKKILFAGVAVCLFFSLLELIAFLCKPLYDKPIAIPPAPENVEPGEEKLVDLHLPYEVKTNLPWSIHYNITRNPLTIADDTLLFRVKPNPSGDSVRGYSGINADGFRGELFADTEETRAAKKVMIIGDSCAFGWAIQNYALTFQASLERLLKHMPEPWRVYNFGQPGHSSAQGRVLFDRWFPKVKPDVLVVYTGWNDIWDTPLLTDRQHLALLRSLNNPLSRGLRKTHTYRALEALFQVLRGPPEGNHASIDGEKVRVPIDEAISNYEHLLAECEKNGTQMIMIPCLRSSRPSWEVDNMIGYNASIREVFEDRMTLLALDEMKHTNPESYRLYADSFHPNEKGARCIAKQLFDVIRKE